MNLMSFIARHMLIIALAGLSIANAPATESGEVVPIVEIPLRQYGITAADCGLYALVAGAACLNKPIEHKSLFGDLDFHVEFDGISSQDLIKLAIKHGLGAKIATDLSSGDLMTATSPVLIPLTFANSKTKHWVAACGAEESGIRVYDNIDQFSVRSPAEIDVLWNGEAIVLGMSDAHAVRSRWRLRFHSVLRKAVILLTCFLIVLAAPLLSVRSGKRGIVLYSAPLLMISILAIFFTSSQRIFAATETLLLTRCWNVVNRNQQSQVPFVRSIENDGDAVLVDCRTTAAFGCGHIPGSINIPINASVSEWQDFLSKIDTSRNMIFYCQSAECGWAETCQRRMSCLGRKASVLSGGYVRYESKTE